MLNNLDPGVRAKLENAFIEAESQLDYHNQSAVDRNTKRIPSNKIAGPVVTVTTNTLGFDLNWPKLRDRVITMYEVQISTNSNFASIQSYNTVDNFFQVEGASSVTYARVRGVRWNGECGPWSRTVSASVAAATSGPVIYSRTVADINPFYRAFPALAYPSPINDMTITPQRENGGVMFFGSFGVEFYVDSTGFRGDRGDHFYIGTAAALDDTLLVTLNGRKIQSMVNIPCFETPGWSNLQSPPQSTVFGYSLGIGPGYLEHAQFYFERFEDIWPNTVSHRNDSRDAVTGTVGSSANHVGWLTKRNLEDPYDDNSGSNDTSTYTTTTFGSFGAGVTHTTRTLVGQNYKFNIPSTSTIKGIEVRFIVSNSGTSLSEQTITRVRLINSDGVPRSTTKGVGDPFVETTYGGPTDLWGEVAGFWTPAKINSTFFGCDIQGHVEYLFASNVDDTVTFTAQGLQITVYTDMGGPEVCNIRVQYKARTNDFYSYPYTRAILKNCTLNAMEFGSRVRV